MTTPATPNRQRSLTGMYLYTAIWGGITLYFGFQELRYSLFAATATATVTHKSQEMRSGGRGGARPVLVLDYSFRDATGAQRNEQDVVPPDWRDNGAVSVEYLPGTIGSSRVKGAKSQGGLLLITSLFAVIGGVIVWLKSVSNAKASEPMEPLVSSATADIANEPRVESSNVRADRKRKRDRQQRESNLPKQSPAAPNELGGPGWHRHESDVPVFAPDSLVCRYAGWMGKPVSVIVDRSAGMIHFQNCFRLAKFWAISAEPWLSCPLNEVRAAHHCNHKGYRSLVIATRSGKARISSDASDYAALCDAMAGFVPHGLRAIHEDHPVVGFLMAFVAFGGLALGYCLTPHGASDTTTFLISCGTGVVCLVLLFMGIKSLNR